MSNNLPNQVITKPIEIVINKSGFFFPKHKQKCIVIIFIDFVSYLILSFIYDKLKSNLIILIFEKLIFISAFIGRNVTKPKLVSNKVVNT